MFNRRSVEEHLRCQTAATEDRMVSKLDLILSPVWHPGQLSWRIGWYVRGDFSWTGYELAGFIRLQGSSDMEHDLTLRGVQYALFETLSVVLYEHYL